MSKHWQKGKPAKALEFAARNGGKNPKAVRLRAEAPVTSALFA